MIEGFKIWFIKKLLIKKYKMIEEYKILFINNLTKIKGNTAQW